MALLEARSINVRFGGHMAVFEATVEVEAGGVTGLIGPNGAGKTTLFNVITGLQEPVAGRVLLDGIDVTGAPPHQRARRGVARTFQRLELFGSLTARENLEVAAEIRRRRGGGGGPSPHEKVDEVIDMIGLGGFASTRADVLTTGQARLVELGRALVTAPRLLLLDEPASGLDADETDELAALLGRLAGDGLGVLLVEHDVPLVLRACRQVYVLDLGRVIACGAPDVIASDPRVLDAYLGAPIEVGHA
jgi:branched-chain amino acid transport system ATP-binding protein